MVRLTDCQFLELLRRHDNTAQGFEPVGFIRLMAEIRFGRLAQEIIDQLGDDCFPMLVREAPVHGSITLPARLLNDDGRVELRISNFGRFATMLEDDAIVNPGVLETLQHILDKYGYRYIPPRVLGQSYDGSSEVDVPHNWCARYFGN